MGKGCRRKSVSKITSMNLENSTSGPGKRYQTQFIVNLFSVLYLKHNRECRIFAKIEDFLPTHFPTFRPPKLQMNINFKLFTLITIIMRLQQHRQSTQEGTSMPSFVARLIVRCWTSGKISIHRQLPMSRTSSNNVLKSKPSLAAR